MNNYAPVLICTLNRHIHFKRCVESLAACTHADKTDLYIGFDYPLKDAHWEGYEIIKAYLPTIKGFKTVNIVVREKNFGIFDNWTGMQNYVFERYDRLIISEDDNVFGQSFLNFVNNGLNIYENRQDIFSVSGYNYPFIMPAWYKFDAYLITGFSGWGVGIWKDKWNKVDWSLNSFNEMFIKKENIKKLKKNYQIWLPNLIEIKKTGIIKGDGLLLLYLINNNMYSLFPLKNRVLNTGNDGSGENCGFNGVYMKQKIFEGFEDAYFPPDLKPDKKILDFFSKQLKLSLIKKTIRLLPPSIRMIVKSILSVNFPLNSDHSKIESSKQTTRSVI